MGVWLLPPADENTIRAVMQEIGRQASVDIIQLYKSTGGFVGGDCDTHVWSLWSLDRVREVNAVYGRPQIAFSDGLVDSFYFCFQYENELVSSIWIDQFDDTVPVRVADSLAEFFDLYLHEPGRIGLL